MLTNLKWPALQIAKAAIKSFFVFDYIIELAVEKQTNVILEAFQTFLALSAGPAQRCISVDVVLLHVRSLS